MLAHPTSISRQCKGPGCRKRCCCSVYDSFLSDHFGMDDLIVPNSACLRACSKRGDRKPCHTSWSVSPFLYEGSRAAILLRTAGTEYEKGGPTRSRPTGGTPGIEEVEVRTSLEPPEGWESMTSTGGAFERADGTGNCVVPKIVFACGSRKRAHTHTHTHR